MARRNPSVQPWTGHVDTFDPAHAARHLHPGQPDPARYPVHARGTWRRAMLLMSQGYRPAREDLEDLGKWSRLGISERKADLAEYDTLLRSVAAAALEVLGDGEALGTTNLATRVAAAGYPGLPGRHTLEDYLHAVTPVDLSMGGTGGGVYISGGRALFRVHLTKAGGSPGHFFASSRVALRKFAVHRRVYLAQRAARAWRGRTDNDTERMTA